MPTLPASSKSRTMWSLFGDQVPGPMNPLAAQVDPIHLGPARPDRRTSHPPSEPSIPPPLRPPTPGRLALAQAHPGRAQVGLLEPLRRHPAAIGHHRVPREPFGIVDGRVGSRCFWIASRYFRITTPDGPVPALRPAPGQSSTPASPAPAAGHKPGGSESDGSRPATARSSTRQSRMISLSSAPHRCPSGDAITPELPVIGIIGSDSKSRNMCCLRIIQSSETVAHPYPGRAAPPNAPPPGATPPD